MSRLKAAFRKLAMKWHPDKNPGDASSEVRFKEINEAYEVLKDGDKRAAYDRFGHAAFEQGAGGGGPGFGAGFASSFSDIFEDLFGMAEPARPRRPRARRRSALQHGDHARRGVSRQNRTDRDPGLRHLRILFGHRRQGRHQAEDLLALRRRRARPPGAGLLHAGADLPGLSGPRPDDRGCLSVVFRLRPGDAGADAVGQHSARRRGRHPHSPRRRRRSRCPRRPARRPLHFPVADPAPVLPARWRRPALPGSDLDGGGSAWAANSRCRPSTRARRR